MIGQSANANVAVLALDLPVKVPAQGRIIDEAIPRILREPGVTVHRAGGTEHKVQRLTLRIVSDLFEAGGARRVLQEFVYAHLGPRLCGYSVFTLARILALPDRNQQKDCYYRRNEKNGDGHL